MKNYLFLILIFIGFTSYCKAQSDKVIMEDNGSRVTKPIGKLTISVNKSDLRYDQIFNKVVVTDKMTLQAIISFLSHYNLDRKHIIKNNNDLDCFTVSIYNNKVKTIVTYYLNSQSDSKIYLRKLIQMLITNKFDVNVVTAYNYVLTRVEQKY